MSTANAGVELGVDAAAAPSLDLSAAANATLPDASLSAEAPAGEGQVVVEEMIQAEGAKQVESGFGFSMPGLSVCCFWLMIDCSLTRVKWVELSW